MAAIPEFAEAYIQQSQGKMQLKDDPTIAEIRETRHRISAAFGHDPQKIIEHYLTLQKEEEKQRAQKDKKDKLPEPVEA